MKQIYGRTNNKTSFTRAINRSGTVSQLPHLKGVYTPRANHNKSNYLLQINNEVGQNVEYDQKSSKFITKQQTKLKSILKRMYDDTSNILSSKTPRQLKNSHHKTAAALLALQQKQSENNQQILERYQKEIHALIEQLDHIEKHDKQFYEAEIINLGEEISVIRETNYLLKKQNERRGKSIVTNEHVLQEGIFRKIETDKYLLEHKVVKLRGEDERVRQEISSILQKTREIQSKYIQADKYMKQYSKLTQQRSSKQHRQKQLMIKKQKLEAYRKKNQFYNMNHQYKYYRLLQNLDTLNSHLKDYSELEDHLDVKISASKELLGKMEKKYEQIMKKKREKEKHLNQFLEQSQFLNERNNRTGRLSEIDGSDQFGYQRIPRDQREQVVIGTPSKSQNMKLRKEQSQQSKRQTSLYKPHLPLLQPKQQQSLQQSKQHPQQQNNQQNNNNNIPPQEIQQNIEKQMEKQ